MSEPVAAVENPGEPAKEATKNPENVLNEARNLVRRISASRGSPEANDLHRLASILENEEIRYIQQVGFAFINTRAAYTIGKLVLLLRDNDELVELINSKLLLEPGHSIQLRASAARLLLALISSYLFRNFFDEVILSKIKEWVAEDSLEEFNPNSSPIPSNPTEKGVRKGKKKKIMKNFDREMLRTYSTGLLASALILEDTVDDVVRAGLVPKLMKFLRSKTIGFNAQDANTDANDHIDNSQSSSLNLDLKNKNNSLPLCDDSSNQEISNENNPLPKSNAESNLKEAAEDVIPSNTSSERPEVGVERIMTTNETCKEKEKGKDVINEPGEKEHDSEEKVDDGEAEEDDKSAKGKKLSKSQFKKQVLKKLMGQESNTHSPHYNESRHVSDKSSHLNRVKRLTLDRRPSTSRDLNPKLADEHPSTFHDLKMKSKDSEDKEDEEEEEEREEKEDSQQIKEKEEQKLNSDLEILERETNLDNLMDLAAKAAKEEASYLNSPPEVVKNAMEVAKEYVKSSFNEILSEGGDPSEALAAAKKHATSIIQTAQTVKTTYDHGLQMKSKSSIPNDPPPKDSEPEKDNNPDNPPDYSFLPSLDELSSLREKYCIQCLASLGEYLEVLGPVLQDRGVDVCLNLLKRKDELLLMDILRLVCSLAAHRKFSTMFVDKGGVQLLLKVPRIIHTFAGLAVCLFALASLQGVMERVCALPSNIVKEIVILATQLLSCPQDVTRKNASLFFAASFVFPVIVHEFDNLDGLPHLIEPLKAMTTSRTGGSMTPNLASWPSTSTHILPTHGPDQHTLPAHAALGSISRGSPESLTSTSRQVTQHACVAFRQYLRAHFFILIESFKVKIQNSKTLTDKKGNARVLNKILDLNDESVENAIEQFQRDRKLASSFVRSRPAFMERISDLGAVSLLLELSQLNPIERVYGEISLSALGALQIVTLLPSLHRAVTVCNLQNQKSGVSVILDATSGSLTPDPEFMQASLLVLVNLVCFPPSLCSKPNLSHSEKSDRRESLSQAPAFSDLPLPTTHVGDRRISLGAGFGSAGLAAYMEHNFRLAREAVRSSNGIKILLHVLNSRTLLHPSYADCLRALACKILLGLAYDSSIAQILSKLQVSNLLSDFLKDSSRPSEKNKWANEFQKLALQLITLTSSAKAIQSTAATNEAAAPTLRRIERASIADSTPISFSHQELLQLIHAHLLHHGLSRTAHLLLEEASIPALPPTPMPTPMKGYTTPNISAQLETAPPSALSWPQRNPSQPLMLEVKSRSSLHEVERGSKSGASDMDVRKKKPCITPVHLRKMKPPNHLVPQSNVSDNSSADNLSDPGPRDKEYNQSQVQEGILSQRKSKPYPSNDPELVKSTNSVLESRTNLTDFHTKSFVERQQHNIQFLKASEDSPLSQTQNFTKLNHPYSPLSIGTKRSRNSDLTHTSSPPPTKKPNLEPRTASIAQSPSLENYSTVPPSQTIQTPSYRGETRSSNFAPNESTNSTFSIESPVPSSFTAVYGTPAGESSDNHTFPNFQEPPGPSLNSIVTSWLKSQHKQCQAPITTLPPLSLSHPHVCPEPKRLLEAPHNVVRRIFSRQINPPCGGRRGRYHDRHFTYSRFRAWRTCRDEGSSLSTCSTFLNSTNRIAVGNVGGEIRLFDTFSGSLLDVFVGHAHPILSLECFPTSFQYSFDHDEENLDIGRLLTSCRNEVKLWDVDFHNGPVLTLKHFRSPKFNHSGNHFAALGTESAVYNIHIFDALTGQSVLSVPDTSSSEINPRTYFASKFHFSPSDEMMLWNGCLFDHRIPKIIHRFDQFTDYGGGGFHPAGNEIILNSEVWDVRAHKLLRSVDSLNQTNLHFNPTGDVIFANLRRLGDEMTDFSSRKRRRHPLFSAFRTIDAVEYLDIATEDVNRQIVDLALEPSDSFVAIVALDDNEDESVVKIYEIGRRRPSDYDSDGDETEDSEAESEREEDIEELINDELDADMNLEAMERDAGRGFDGEDEEDEDEDEEDEDDDDMSDEEDDLEGNSEFGDSMDEEEHEVLRILSGNGAVVMDHDDEDEEDDGFSSEDE